MKNFEIPFVEIVAFESMDIVTTSDFFDDEGFNNQVVKP